MKMCNISVDPIPSSASMPGYSLIPSKVLGGSGSPALTMRRSEEKSAAASVSSCSLSIWLNAVGMEARIVTSPSVMASSRSSASGAWMMRVAAPKRNGNATSMP
jgi:hypothetical protein